jgi:hypothetical protein
MSDVVSAPSHAFIVQYIAIVGVNARVSYATEWITATVCEMSDSPLEFCFPLKTTTRFDARWKIAFVACILTATSAIFFLGRKRYKRTAYVELSTT